MRPQSPVRPRRCLASGPADSRAEWRLRSREPTDSATAKMLAKHEHGEQDGEDRFQVEEKRAGKRGGPGESEEHQYRTEDAAEPDDEAEGRHVGAAEPCFRRPPAAK